MTRMIICNLASLFPPRKYTIKMTSWKFGGSQSPQNNKWPSLASRYSFQQEFKPLAFCVRRYVLHPSDFNQLPLMLSVRRSPAEICGLWLSRPFFHAQKLFFNPSFQGKYFSRNLVGDLGHWGWGGKPSPELAARTSIKKSVRIGRCCCHQQFQGSKVQ